MRNGPFLLLVSVTMWAGGSDVAEAQFVQDIVGQFRFENRLRSRGEATSAGDPGDPRGESTASEGGYVSADRERVPNNDPFSDRRLDPRVGPRFDPQAASEGRFFKGTNRRERETIVPVIPRRTTPPPARRRTFSSEVRPQYLNRLGTEFRRMPISDSDLKTIDALQRSLDSMCQGRVYLSWEDHVLVLQGRVATRHRKQMLEQFVLLEPGISQVRNEIIVD